jgi:hypothetical protein
MGEKVRKTAQTPTAAAPAKTMGVGRGIILLKTPFFMGFVIML